MISSLIAIGVLLLGGSIYIFCRSESLIMFYWFNELGVLNHVQVLRTYLEPYYSIFPYWVCFSLPQALWLFSGIVLFHSIWDYSKRFNGFLWSLIFIGIAFGFEFGQYLQIIPGYFDVMDVIMLIITCLAAIVFVNLFSKEEEYS